MKREKAFPASPTRQEGLAATSRAALEGMASTNPSLSAAPAATPATKSKVPAAPGMSSPPPLASSPPPPAKSKSSPAPAAAQPISVTVKPAAPSPAPAAVEQASRSAVQSTNSKPPAPPAPPAPEVEPPVTIDGLKAKREQIIHQLHIIRATLFANNELVGETQGIPDATDPYDVNWLTYRPKGVPYDVLTYRGREKALDLLRRFDRDRDDKLDFSDFRGYLEHFGRTEEFGYLLDHRESWLSFVDDVYETDKQGRLTANGFLMHRQEVERRHLLTHDLAALGMDPLTTTARAYRRAGEAFDRLDVECQKSSMDRMMRRGGAAGAIRPCGKLPMEQLQLLLSDCGEAMGVQRGKELMLYHNEHQRLMASLLERFSRKDLTRKRTPVEGMDEEDEGAGQWVYKRGFWAWFMSGRPRQETRWIERWLILAKSGAKRWVREMTKTVAFVWKHAMLGIRRGVIHASVFTPFKQETARYEAGIRVGRTDNLSGGMMMTIRFQQLDSERAARKKTGMPASSGMALLFDLCIRPDAKPVDLIAAIASVKAVVKEHLESEILKLPRFLNWQVFPTISDLDELKVIRIAIYLKSDMHVDSVLKRLQLGFTLRDLVTDLNLEIRTNVDARTVCDDEEYVADEQFGARVEMKANLCRGLVSRLLEEGFTCMQDVHEGRSREEEYQHKEAHKGKERTLEGDPEDGSARFLRETFKFHFHRRPPIEEAVGGLTPSEPPDPEAEALLDFKFFDSWGRAALLLQRYLRITKAATWDLCFRCLTDALQGTAFARALVPPWLLANGVLTKPGGISDASRRVKTMLFNEIERVRRSVEEYERRVKAREERELAELGEEGLKKKKHEKEKAEMLKRLQALSLKATGGIIVSRKKAGAGNNDDDDDDEEDEEDEEKEGGRRQPGGGSTRVAALRKMRKKNLKTQKAVMDCYKLLASTVLGLHSVHVVSGRYRLYAHLEGLDLFDTVLPMPLDPEAAAKSPGGHRRRKVVA